MQASDQTWFCNLDGTCELAEGPVAVLYYSLSAGNEPGIGQNCILLEVSVV